jgi:DNA polymerase III epsilon subunit-like protein
MSSETERVMLDIETLGLEPGVAILSIGAVKFSRRGLGETFDRSISLSSCQEAGLTIDAGTLEWWLDQEDAAREVLAGGDRLGHVLPDFRAFYGDADEIWAYSPQFDCAILERAYEAFDEAPPWTYQDERDCRTLAALPVWPDLEQEGVEHDALDDAIYQAQQTVEVLRSLTDDGSEI